MFPLDLEPQNLATTLATLLQAPMLGALAWMLHLMRRGPPRNDEGCDSDALSRTRDELAAFKVEVARIYVPLSLIRDVDQRLTRQLLRIEEKLDAATRAATAANARQGWRPEDPR